MGERTPDLDDSTREELAEPDRLSGILADGVVGAAGGLVGTTTMTVVLLVAQRFDAFSMNAFGDLARMLGLNPLVPPVLFGFVLFLLAGMIPWPLLFASIKHVMPGRRDAEKGVVFGTILWSGFVFGFYEDYVGLALVLYLGLTLVAHWAYGASVGLVFEYLSSREETLV